MPDPNPETHVCASLRKCTWTLHKSHFVWQFAGNWPDTDENTSIKHRALTLTLKTCSVVRISSRIFLRGWGLAVSPEGLVSFCYASRGPTMCSGGKCYCKPGLCAEACPELSRIAAAWDPNRIQQQRLISAMYIDYQGEGVENWSLARMATACLLGWWILIWGAVPIRSTRSGDWWRQRGFHQRVSPPFR